MRHGYSMSFYYGEWMIAFFIGGLLAIIVGLIWFLHRRTVASDGLTPLERENLTSWEREILSMLRQNGGPMRQDKIVDELPGDLEMFSEILQGLETKGLLQRKWEAGQGTYLISIHS